MSAPFGYKDVGELMGSWPLTYTPGTTTQQAQPNALSPKATMVGTVQESTDGYLVGGLSMKIWVSVAAVPTEHTVLFTAGVGSGLTGNHYTLAEVIAAINAVLPANTAQNSNNFLLLQDQTAGATSYLRLESIATSEGIFQVLGLHPEIIIRGGDLKHAQHIDPSRQIALPGQLGMQHGENFATDVINRLAMQLGLNAGYSKGVVDQRRVCTLVTETLVGDGANEFRLNTANPSQGVYTGPVATPSFDQLLDVVAVLDTDGNEFTKEMQDPPTTTVSDIDFSVETNTNKQLVTSPSLTFTSDDVKNNVYVRIDNFAVATALNGVPMKVLEYRDANTAVVAPIDPTDGSTVAITESGRTGYRVTIYTVRAEVEGFYQQTGGITELEQVQIPVSGGSASVSAIETPNRIRCDSATFTNAQVGDLVVWSSAASITPYSNNGNYRISKIIDATRIELVDENYDPVVLNLDVAGSLGSVVVSSDGDFYPQPYILLAPATGGNLAAGRGAIPDNLENFQVVYMVSKTLRESLIDDPQALVGPVRYKSEAVKDVQAALTRLAGPSVSSFSDILHGSYDRSLEKLDFQLNKEHYQEDGRHSDIRPDTINMWPEVTGATVTARTATADDPEDVKVRLLASNGVTHVLSIGADGRLHIGNVSTLTYTSPFTGDDLRFAVRPFNSQNADVGFVAYSAQVRVQLFSQDQAYANVAALSATAADDATGIYLGNYSTDGGAVHRTWILSTAVEDGTDKALLRLGVLDDGTATEVPNVFVVGDDGRVMFHGPSSGAFPLATTSITITARDTDADILRLKGAPAVTDPTVALSYSPGSDLFAFVEIDHDNPGAAGDWFFNFVTTADLDTDSDGTIGSGSFRWVVGAAGFGVGTELARLNSLGGLNLGVGTVSTDADALVPRVTFTSRDGSYASRTFTNLIDMVSDSGEAMVRFSTTGGSDGALVMNINAKITDTDEWTPDVVSEPAAQWEWWQTSSAQNFTVRYANPAGTGAAFDFTAWDQTVALTLSNTGSVNWTDLYLQNGTVRLDSPTSERSNPAATAAPLANTLYAKSLVKAWGIVQYDDTGDTFALSDGFNVDGSSIGETSGAWDIPLHIDAADATAGMCVVATVSAHFFPTVNISRLEVAPQATDSFRIYGRDTSNSIVDITPTGSTEKITIAFVVFGETA